MTEYWSETSNGHRGPAKADYQNQLYRNVVKQTQDEDRDVNESSAVKKKSRKSKSSKNKAPASSDDGSKSSNVKLDKNSNFSTERNSMEMEDDEMMTNMSAEETLEEKYEQQLSFRSKSSSVNNIDISGSSNNINNNNSSAEQNKTSSDTGPSESNSDDDGTLPSGEPSGKVEQIAQKLEQTAQKYTERKSESSKDQQKYNGYMSSRADFIRNTSMTPELSQGSTLSFERPSYKKRESSHFVERPRPPSTEAPERPIIPSATMQHSKSRDRRKEEILRSSRPQTDKDRGYESNFETKLERTKVLERHGYLEDSKINEYYSRYDQHQNDRNNNTLQMGKAYKGMKPRQSGSLQHFSAYKGLPDKNHKLNVKRTKSFWRFRKDSDVLEGMALWQHRSLVDIPKVVRREACEAEGKDWSRHSSSERSIECGEMDKRFRTLERKNSDSTITEERIQKQLAKVEPSRGERINRIEKSMQYLIEQPRSHQMEYKRHQEDRSQYFGTGGGNISRRAIIENERKRNGEIQKNSTPEDSNIRRKQKAYKQDDDGLIIHRFTETEASDEESNYSCIVIKDQVVSEKRLLPRTKLRRDGHRSDKGKNTVNSWDDPWTESRVNHRKKKKNVEPSH